MSKTPEKFVAHVNGRTIEMRIFDVAHAEQMLPLVGGLANEIVERLCRIRHLEGRLAKTHRRRRELEWPQRRERYGVMDELEAERKAYASTIHEVDALGIWIETPVHGVVHFPTVVDMRAAFFCWQPGEDHLTHWHYSGEPCAERQPIPEDWRKSDNPSQSERISV